MDTRQLSYFVQVAKDNSFTVAARNLHLSQPALSKMIKKLEEDLGVQLFDRSEHKMTLTDAGEKLFEEGQRLLSEMDAITDAIQDTKNLHILPVRAVPESLSHWFMSLKREDRNTALLPFALGAAWVSQQSLRML
jgi:DNA-binding transcriptional LysR family regulator